MYYDMIFNQICNGKVYFPNAISFVSINHVKHILQWVFFFIVFILDSIIFCTSSCHCEWWSISILSYHKLFLQELNEKRPLPDLEMIRMSLANHWLVISAFDGKTKNKTLHTFLFSIWRVFEFHFLIQIFSEIFLGSCLREVLVTQNGYWLFRSAL